MVMAVCSQVAWLWPGMSTYLSKYEYIVMAGYMTSPQQVTVGRTVVHPDQAGGATSAHQTEPN